MKDLEPPFLTKIVISGSISSPKMEATGLRSVIKPIHSNTRGSRGCLKYINSVFMSIVGLFDVIIP